MFITSKRLLLILLSLIAVIFIYYYIKKYKKNNIGYSLLLGGIIGNLLDRIFYSSVIDYILLKFIDFPIFNLADSCIVIGVIILIVLII